jgi:hypothetical protein
MTMQTEKTEFHSHSHAQSLLTEFSRQALHALAKTAETWRCLILLTSTHEASSIKVLTIIQGPDNVPSGIKITVTELLCSLGPSEVNILGAGALSAPTAAL